jgi:hypothetical protein
MTRYFCHVPEHILTVLDEPRDDDVALHYIVSNISPTTALVLLCQLRNNFFTGNFSTPNHATNLKNGTKKEPLMFSETLS